MYKNQIYLNYLIMAAVGVLGLIVVLFHISYDLRNYYLFSVLFMVMIVANKLLVGNVSLIDIVSNLFLVGVIGTMLIVRWSVLQGAFMFYITFIVLTLQFLLGHSATVLSHSSNNYVSVLIILMAILYYCPFDWNGRNLRLIDLLPAVFGFFLSVLAAGRGGILSSGILMVFVFIKYSLKKTESPLKRLIAIICVIAVVGAVLVFDADILLQGFLNLGNFQSKGTSSSIRYSIWGEYIHTALANPKNLIFGAPLKSIKIIQPFGGNVHNSFLQLHAMGGIFVVLLFLVYLIRAVVLYIRNRQFFILSLLVVLIIRGMTDKFIFGQYGMPVLMFLILYPLAEQDEIERILR